VVRRDGHRPRAGRIDMYIVREHRGGVQHQQSACTWHPDKSSMQETVDVRIGVTAMLKTFA